jgi:hypothetical protein
MSGQNTKEEKKKKRKRTSDSDDVDDDRDESVRNMKRTNDKLEDESKLDEEKKVKKKTDKADDARHFVIHVEGEGVADSELYVVKFKQLPSELERMIRINNIGYKLESYIASAVLQLFPKTTKTMVLTRVDDTSNIDDIVESMVDMADYSIKTHYVEFQREDSTDDRDYERPVRKLNRRELIKNATFEPFDVTMFWKGIRYEVEGKAKGWL